MKKVLLLMPRDSSFLPPIVKYFKQKRWQTFVYDYRKGSMPIRILRFTPLVGGFEKASSKLSEDILEVTNKIKPNLIFVIKGETLSRDLIRKIKNKNNKIVNWFPDPMNLWDLMIKIAPGYDFFLHFDPLIVRKLKRLGHKNVIHVPFAAEIQKRIDKPKIYDISFVGTYSKDREEKLSKLMKFDLNIWGDPR